MFLFTAEMEEFQEIIFYRIYKMLYEDIATVLEEQHGTFVNEVLQNGLSSQLWETLEPFRYHDSRIRVLKEYFEKLTERPHSETIDNFKYLIKVLITLQELDFEEGSRAKSDIIESAWKQGESPLSDRHIYRIKTVPNYLYYTYNFS